MDTGYRAFRYSGHDSERDRTSTSHESGSSWQLEEHVSEKRRIARNEKQRREADGSQVSVTRTHGKSRASSPEGFPADLLRDPDRLVELARQRAGADPGQSVFSEEGLRVLCESLTTGLSGARYRGRARAQAVVIESLVKGMRLSQQLTRHQNLERTKLPAPVFIVAPFRTGTTFLHRLLAHDERFRWTRTFEVSLAPPASGEGDGEAACLERDPRIGRTRRDLKQLYRWSPALESLHETGPLLPEECFGLLETSLCSHSFMFYGPVENYLEWLATRNRTQWLETYGIYANQLRVLHRRMPGERWLLKNPAHLWNLDVLFDVFEDATVIQTHRPGDATAASFCNLLAAHHSLVLRTVGDRAIGRLARAYLTEAIQRGVRARRCLGEERFIDISARDLRRDPMGCVAMIYSRLGLALRRDTAQRMEEWARTNTPAEGPRRSDLQRYGLHERTAREIFAPYDALGEQA